MRAIRLNQSELEELMNVMSIGNTALKECADMMNMTHRSFRGQLFNNKLDTSALNAEQLQKLTAAKPLIFAVRDQCEEKVRAGFKRMVSKQAFTASKNNYDPNSAKEEFLQEGEIAVLDAIYGYTDKTIKLYTFVWRCVRRRIMRAINRLNPLCPLTNEALRLIYRVQDARNKNSELTETQAVNALGLSDSERDVFFKSITKVLHQQTTTPDPHGDAHGDDYTGNRRNVDHDIGEVLFIRQEARQAVKNADLDELELACLMAELFPYHGWKEDIAKRHINKNTGKRYTRQNIEHVLARVMKKVQKVYLNPPETQLENSLVDKFFDDWSAEKAVKGE